MRAVTAWISAAPARLTQGRFTNTRAPTGVRTHVCRKCAGKRTTGGIATAHGSGFAGLEGFAGHPSEAGDQTHNLCRDSILSARAEVFNILAGRVMRRARVGAHSDCLLLELRRQSPRRGQGAPHGFSWFLRPKALFPGAVRGWRLDRGRADRVLPRLSSRRCAPESCGALLRSERLA